MTKQAEALLREALELSTDEREQLAAEILASLDADALEDAELAWATEIEERARRVLAGESRGKPWPEVRDRIRREVLGR
jgi:putative addiction module component (TIGR02574 family)